MRGRQFHGVEVLGWRHFLDSLILQLRDFDHILISRRSNLSCRFIGRWLNLARWTNLNNSPPRSIRRIKSLNRHRLIIFKTLSLILAKRLLWLHQTSSRVNLIVIFRFIVLTRVMIFRFFRYIFYTSKTFFFIIFLIQTIQLEFY